MGKNMVFGMLLALLSAWGASAGAAEMPVYERAQLHMEGELLTDAENRPVTGEVRSRYENGKILEKLSYVNGKKEGKQFLYGLNGRVLAEANFVNSEEDGEAKLFYGTGGLLASLAFEKGMPVRGYCIQESGQRIDLDAEQLAEFQRTSELPCRFMPNE